MVNQQIARDLRALGIRSDDVILMHSSLSALGYVEGGADTVIDTLLEVLKDGTLLIPALSYETVTADSPNFSVKDSPSCIGKISETFRTRPGVLRSMHPTHSVCGVGRFAEEILSRHIETETPVGETSPFALLPKYGGKVLMLGCGLRPNTSMHGVEELVKPDYLLHPEPLEYRLTGYDGNTVSKTYRRHDFRTAIQRYDRLADKMEITCGKVINATCYLIDAKTMWQVGEKTLREDPHFFIDPR
ncbi:MAG: AAC(3) family N-acetyltransferase [Clostridia bacterium]|nr:AAC(3) family N-acetyltransferase [Clostridia bacterium]